MIICPNCQYKEMTGAIHCSNCGAQLVRLTPATGELPIVGIDPEARRSSKREMPSSPVNLHPRLSLKMVDSGQILPLADRTEFTLGRSGEGQPILPDVDLTPHGAFDNGVSRLHAILKMVEERLVIMDLGSSNGSYLNGSRLPPFLETPVIHGDIIDLGKQKIQLLVDQ